MPKAENRHLTPEAAGLFRRLAKEWRIRDEAGKLLLTIALRAYDEMRAAETVLTVEGTYVNDRWGQKKLHPAAQRQKESRAHLLMTLKMLNLDLESLEGR